MTEKLGLDFEEELYSILKQYKEESGDEPLDRDEVDKLCDILKAKLNYIEGNITREEYMEIKI